MVPAGGRWHDGGRFHAVRARPFYAWLLAWQLAAWPGAVPAALAREPPRDGIAVSVEDGDTIVLASGRKLRLVGIQAPKLAARRAGSRPWPMAEEAKAGLEALVVGRRLALAYHERRIDRHRRLLAHAEVRAAGRAVWVQGEMLRRGLARVYTFADNRALATEMLTAEREARAAGRGIWALRYYRILPHDRAGRFVGTFQLVEGRVRAAAVVRKRAFLNFDADWRTDFTITVAPRDMRRFRRAGIEPEALAGCVVRVRGWLASRNGPSIAATHPEQLELPEGPDGRCPQPPPRGASPD